MSEEVEKEIEELETRLRELKKERRRPRVELVLRVMDGDKLVAEEVRRLPQLSADDMLQIRPAPLPADQSDVEGPAMELVANKIRALPLADMVRVLLKRARMKPVG